MNLSPVLEFLRKLQRNNNREWFESHKNQYLLAKNTFGDFLEALHKELIKFDDLLAGMDPRKAAFRIYRDVRFSKDKRPYKTNMGATFSPHGKMEQEPGYYLHIEPGNSFVAGGLYMPHAENLARVRQEIDYNGEVLLKILNDRKFKSFFSGLDEFDRLKTAPKGYAKDHPHIELLRNRSFVVSHGFTDAEVLHKNFVSHTSKVCRAMKPFIDFLRMALDE
jgi:uncharacterized protein (TIGR02453 family)